MSNYPPLPEAPVIGTSRFGSIFRGHSDDAMRAYVDADRKDRQLTACNFCLAQAADARAALAATPAPEAVLGRSALIDLIEERLYAVYHCTRVWSAWQVGTMSEDDFTEARGTDLAPDIADAVISALKAAQLAERATVQESLTVAGPDDTPLETGEGDARG